MADKAIFLDRDDTLIEDPGFINHPDQVKLLDGVAEALTELKALGYKLIVASNQSGVARGIVSEKTLGQIHDRLRQLLTESGAHLDGIYYCPYHPDGVVPKYRKDSDLRKPNPGMLLAAADEMNIDLNQSWLIGNSDRDIEAGLKAGCQTILINQSPHQKLTEPGQSNPDYRAVNMREAANIIKKYHRSFRELPAQVQATKSQVDSASQDVEHHHPRPEITQPKNAPKEQKISVDRTEQLLSSILSQLKRMQRDDIFGEFSIMRLIAGIVQIVVLFCLLISIWFLMSPTRQDNSVLITLGFAILLQLMSLTFYIMHGRK
ncbi:MAG: D-glycero-alpha-D-manno-heptose-1,7-bisphosphate 7-phosphatase [Planctomycetota bacterium]|jgi:D,D-heptose 1,7-bisphosphate phosphatase